MSQAQPPAKWAPRLPAHEAPDAWPYEELEAGESYRQLNLEGVAWQAADAVSFAGVRIGQARLDGLRLKRWVLDDALLRGCSLAGTELAEASGQRLRWESCRLTGAKLPKARFKQVAFVDCQAQYLVAEGLVLVDGAFLGGSFAEANFDGADLRGVVFDGCDLRDASFLGAKLEGADFRRANLEAARVRLGDLQGALVAQHQAVALFVRHSGAVLEDGVG